MKAIILAGGLGTRLRSVIYDRPKSMAPIVGMPFLEHLMRLLMEQGITEIILCISHMANQIKSYFGNGSRWGFDITYSEEEIPLGTAGAIKKAKRYIDNTFLVLNGDSYSNLNLKQFLDFHKSKRSNFTLALTKVNDSSHFGNVVLKEDKIIEFSEKKDSNEGFVNSGFYIFEPKLFDYIESDRNLSLEKDIFPQLAKEGILWGYSYEGYFIDIGRPETYVKFKEDVLNSILLNEHHKVRDAMKKISESGINLVLVTDKDKKLQGVITDRILRHFMLKGGNLDESLDKAMIKDPITVKTTDPKDKIIEILMSGINQLPVIDKEGRVVDIEFHTERIKSEVYPIVRGKAPLRISFAGGGTDLAYFFEKYGGAVINSTINKYCYGTIIKRADKKILINSDLEHDMLFNSIEELRYDGKLDLVKAIIKIIQPDFGFELYLHSDLPPGRGLGSSASLAVLILSLFNQLMDTRYNDYTIAELAFRAEREELKIKGGWQDQYATVIGGFNFMEFSKDKSIVYPLKLKKEAIDELENHTFLCYVGKSRESGEIHKQQEQSFYQDEKEKIAKMLRLKELTYEIRESLLTNNLETFGRHLNETWNIKRSLSGAISNEKVDILYKIGLKNGAYGGRLLGAGAGGYILFFFSPKKRNELKKALEDVGGDVTNFSFESDGIQVWNSKNRF